MKIGDFVHDILDRELVDEGLEPWLGEILDIDVGYEYPILVRWHTGAQERCTGAQLKVIELPG